MEESVILSAAGTCKPAELSDKTYVELFERMTANAMKDIGSVSERRVTVR